MSRAELILPKPGEIVTLSPVSNPAVLKGIKVFADKPFKFDFILDQGDANLSSPNQGQPGDIVSLGAKAPIESVSPSRLPSDSPLQSRTSKGNTASRKAIAQTNKEEINRLIKYFLASLTTPENDLWVNLSPYEKDRIVPSEFGQTAMGRDLLAEDYLLKQITASLMHPDGEVGKKFWQKIYAEATKRYGSTQVPVNTFNKVWIVPDQAEVYEGPTPTRGHVQKEHQNVSPRRLPSDQALKLKASQGDNSSPKEYTAYITKATLKVMLEEDYLSQSKNALRQPGDIVSLGAINAPIESVSPRRQPSESPLQSKTSQGNPASRNQDSPNELSKNIIKEIIIPELEKEINQGSNFAQLRQIYHSLILATWYKKKIKQSIIAKQYVDQKKIKGIALRQPGDIVSLGAKAPIESVSPRRLPSENPLQSKTPQGANLTPNEIYHQYLKSFKQGAYNLIKEEPDPITGQAIPRKYFAGGAKMAIKDLAQTTEKPNKPHNAVVVNVKMAQDEAMLGDNRASKQGIFKNVLRRNILKLGAITALVLLPTLNMNENVGSKNQESFSSQNISIHKNETDVKKEQLINQIVGYIKVYRPNSQDPQQEALVVYDSLIGLWGKDKLHVIKSANIDVIIRNFVIRGVDQMQSRLNNLKDILGDRVLAFMAIHPLVLEDRSILHHNGIMLVEGINEQSIESIKQLHDKHAFLFDTQGIRAKKWNNQAKELIQITADLQSMATQNGSLNNPVLVGQLKTLLLSILALYPSVRSINEETYNNILMSILFDTSIIQGDNAHGLNVGIVTLQTLSPVNLLVTLAHELGHYVSITDFFLNNFADQSAQYNLRGAYQYSLGIEELMADLGAFAWVEEFGDWNKDGQIKTVEAIIREAQSNIGYITFAYANRFPLEMHYVPRTQMQWVINALANKGLKSIQWKVFYQVATHVYQQLKQEHVEHLGIFVQRVLAEYLFETNVYGQSKKQQLLEEKVKYVSPDLIAPQELKRILDLPDRAMSAAQFEYQLTGQEYDAVVRRIIDQSVEQKIEYFRRYSGGLANVLDIERYQDRIRHRLERRFAKSENASLSPIILKDKHGYFWFVKLPKVRQDGETAVIFQNIIKQERLGYNILKDQANVLPVRELTVQEIGQFGLTEKAQGGAIYASRLILDNQRQSFTAQNKFSVMNSLFVGHVLAGIYDYSSANRFERTDVVVGFDLDTTLVPNYSLEQFDEMQAMFVYALIYHWVWIFLNDALQQQYTVIENFKNFAPMDANGHLIWPRTKEEAYQRVKSFSRFLAEYQLNQGFKQSDYLDEERMRQAIARFKIPVPFDQRATSAGYMSSEAQQIGRILQKRQANLGAAIDEIWGYMFQQRSRFKDLDQAMLSQNEWANQLTANYKLDSMESVQELATTIVREDNTLEKKENQYSYLITSDGRKLIEFSPLGVRRYFDKSGNWILEVDPHGYPTARLFWNSEQKLERVEYRALSGMWMTVKEDGAYGQSLDKRLVSVFYGDDKRRCSYFTDSMGVDFINQLSLVGGIQVVLKEQERLLTAGHGLLLLNLMANLARLYERDIQLSELSGATEILLANLKDVSLLDKRITVDALELMTNSQIKPSANDMIRNPESNIILVINPRTREVKRVFYLGDAYINVDIKLKNENWGSWVSFHKDIGEIYRQGKWIATIDSVGKVLKTPQDAAMNSSTGGIDLNSIERQLKVSGEEIFEFNQQQLENISINSLTPVIIGIEPLKSLESFLAPA